MSSLVSILIIALLVISFIVAFAIGSNDEAMAPAVGARVFTVNTAVLLGGFITIIGAVFMGGGVSEKVGADLVGGQQMTTAMVFAILISMAIWLLIASITKGLPISTTQCIVGSVVGVAIAAPFLGESGWGMESVDWYVVFEILVGWVISPIIGFFIAGLVYAGIRRIQAKATGLSSLEGQERVAGYLLAIFLIVISLSRGGNDVANAVAPLVSLPEFDYIIDFGWIQFPGIVVPLLVAGIGMALGLIVVGRKVIRVLATEVVTLSPSSALAASVSVSLVMFIGTYLGFPLSGTHILVAALIAVGWIAREPIKKKQVNEILISWVITVPISAVFGVIVFYFTNMLL
ncbi:MAG: anion permease [Candidatus Thorarchaeota archaeon]